MRGPWPLDQVSFVPATSSRVRDPEVEELVDQTWAAQCAAAEAFGVPLHDAPAYRVESIAPGPVFELALEPYRVHSAMKLLHVDPRVRPEHLDRILVVDALLRTADDRSLLIRTPKITGFELQLVGGTATPEQQVIDGPSGLAAFALQRIGLALDGVREPSVAAVLGLVDHPVGCVNLVLDVRTVAMARDISARGRRELHVVEPGGLETYLRGSPGYLPLVADLL